MELIPLTSQKRARAKVMASRKEKGRRATRETTMNGEAGEMLADRRSVLLYLGGRFYEGREAESRIGWTHDTRALGRFGR